MLQKMVCIPLAGPSDLPVWFLCWAVIVKVGSTVPTTDLSFPYSESGARQLRVSLGTLTPSWLLFLFLAEAQTGKVTAPRPSQPMFISLILHHIPHHHQILEAQFFFLLLLIQAVPTSLAPRTPVVSGRALIPRDQNQP